MVDPTLGSNFNEDEAARMIKVALLCTSTSPTHRPVMSAVVSMLEGKTAVHETLTDPSNYNDRLRLTDLREQFNHSVPQSSAGSQSLVRQCPQSSEGQSSASKSNHESSS